MYLVFTILYTLLPTPPAPTFSLPPAPPLSTPSKLPPPPPLYSQHPAPPLYLQHAPLLPRQKCRGPCCVCRGL